jgi:hypothetical protein
MEPASSTEHYTDQYFIAKYVWIVTTGIKFAGKFESIVLTALSFADIEVLNNCAVRKEDREVSS